MTDHAETIARSSAAERMRLHRERMRNGIRPLWIELRVTEIDALVRIGLLKAETRNDPNAVRDALYGRGLATENRPAPSRCGRNRMP
jgi:hypothetical protein